MRKCVASASEWLTTQETGPEKRRFQALVNVLNRDALLLEQFLIR
jgi:hypothetical protein